MARNEVDITGMRPKMGASSLVLPITFDYSGGRADKSRTAKTWSIILAVLGSIICVGNLFNKERNFFLSLLISIVIASIFLFIIRFPLQKEGKLRTEKIKLKDSDGVLNPQSFWGIYDIEEIYPHICRFRTGKSGVFILLNKDVILGKFTEAEFDHYEAIGDAYNIAGSSNIQMCHLDYMDIVGSDKRLDQSFIELQNVKNEDVKDILTDIYTFQQEQMSRMITTFDAYVFLWSGNDITAWNTIQRILSCLMDANYRSYQVLDRSAIRELASTILMLQNFSAEDSMLKAFVSESSRGVVPIQVIHSDGTVEKLNKTVAEKREEAELAEKRKQAKREERQNSKKKQSNEEEIDLF